MNFQVLGSRWLWDENSDDKINQYVCFRKEFDLEAVEKFSLHICADTNYVAWLNGSLIGFGGYLAYPENKYYDTLDISGKLRCGKNVLCVLAYYQGINTSCYAKGTPGMIFALTGRKRVISNEGTSLCKGSGFLDGEVPLVSVQLGPSFAYDANRETDWIAVEPKEQSFRPAKELDFSKHLPVSLKKRPIAKLDISVFCEGKLITQGFFEYPDANQTPSQNMQFAAMSYMERDKVFENDRLAGGNIYLIYDLGEETAGHIEFDIDAAAETQIDIACGEHLDDMRVRAFVGGRNFGFRYIAKEGANHFTSWFRRTSGRYLQVNINNANAGCKINSIGLRIATYPLAVIKLLKTDDALCQTIDKTCIRTLTLCMHEHYEDTPWREQCLYAMDSRIQALCGYYIFGNYKFAKASFDLLGWSLREDGFLDLCAPSVIPITIPSFSFMWISAACEYVLFSGDIRTGEGYFRQIQDMLSRYFDMFENGIIRNPAGEKYWHFYDWQPYLDGAVWQDFDVLLNLFLYYAILKTTELAELLEKSEKIALTRFLKKFKASINEHFYNTGKKRYSTFQKSSEHYNECELAQSIALCCGICPNPKILRKQIAQTNDMTPVTLNTTIFKYDALLQDISYKPFVLDEIKRIWGGMLLKGATTFYETQEGADAFDRAGSLCHGWSAVPAYVFRKYYQ